MSNPSEAIVRDQGAETSSAFPSSPPDGWEDFRNALKIFCTEQNVGVNEALRTAAGRLLQPDGSPAQTKFLGHAFAMREERHRVRNEFSMLTALMRLRRRKAATDAERTAYHSCIQQIEATARLHDLLENPQPAGQIDLAAYLGTVCDLFSETFAIKRRVRIYLDADAILVPDKIALPTALIVNEAMTNAVKHAFPGCRRGDIHVVLKRAKNNEVRLTISDNGVGCKDDASIRSGMRLIQALTAQINGRLDRPHSETGFCLRCQFDAA